MSRLVLYSFWEKIMLPILCHVFVTFSTNFFNVTVFLLSNYKIVYHREITTKMIPVVPFENTRQIVDETK